MMAKLRKAVRFMKVLGRWFRKNPWTHIIKPTLKWIRGGLGRRVHTLTHVKWGGLPGKVFGNFARWKFAIAGVLALIVLSALGLAKAMTSESDNWNLFWKIIPVIIIIATIMWSLRGSRTKPQAAATATTSKKKWQVIGWTVAVLAIVWLLVSLLSKCEWNVPSWPANQCAVDPSNAGRPADSVKKDSSNRTKGADGLFSATEFGSMPDKFGIRMLPHDKNQLIFALIEPGTEDMRRSVCALKKNGDTWSGVWKNCYRPELSGLIELKETAEYSNRFKGQLSKSMANEWHYQIELEITRQTD